MHGVPRAFGAKADVAWVSGRRPFADAHKVGPRRWAGLTGLIALVLVAAACGSSSSDAATTTAVKAAPTTAATALAKPPAAGDLPAEGPQVYKTIKVPGADTVTYVTDYPHSMNKCDYSASSLVWQSTGGPVVMGTTAADLDIGSVKPTDLSGHSVSDHGTMTLDGCNQPGWALPPGQTSPVTVTLTYQHFQGAIPEIPATTATPATAPAPAPAPAPARAPAPAPATAPSTAPPATDPCGGSGCGGDCGDHCVEPPTTLDCVPAPPGRDPSDGMGAGYC